jgi:hypothetical protein
MNHVQHNFRIYEADEETNVCVWINDPSSKEVVSYQGTELGDRLEDVGLFEIGPGMFEYGSKTTVNKVRTIMQTFGFVEV